MKNRMINLVVLLIGCLALSPAADAGPGATPTANVNVVNTPNVNVSNTPTVTVGNFPGTQPVSGSVQVGNDIAHPVPVRDVDNPARQPFQAGGFAPFSANETNVIVNIATVPTGKRLVIEHVSVSCSLPTGQKMVEADLEVVLSNQTTYPNNLRVSAQGSDASGTHDLSIASEQVRLYADPGTPVRCFVDRDSFSGSGDVQCSISGYLVDVP